MRGYGSAGAMQRVWAGLAGAVVCLGAAAAHADTFTSGSTGALGDVTISTNTEIVLPPDGILNYGSLTVKSGVTVTFKRNGRNTPAFVLATKDIVLEANSSIDVSGEPGRSNGLGGRGGPGGFAGGSNIDSGQLGGAGQGPGGGHSKASTYGGFGSYGKAGGASYGGPGAVYGTQLLMPLIGGSGGGGGLGSGGGGGGGAILLSSTTRIALAGGTVVRAEGKCPPAGVACGSGGAVRLVAPVVEGTGQLSVYTPGSGSGRARIDTLYNTNLAITVSPADAPYTIGSVMLSFLDVEPQIDILGVGQHSVPDDYDGEYLVFLPTGSGATQDITVRLTDFSGVVPITVALTPEVGDVKFYNVDVDMAAAVGGVTSTDVTVDFPLNVATFVHVWTRPATP